MSEIKPWKFEVVQANVLPSLPCMPRSLQFGHPKLRNWSLFMTCRHCKQARNVLVESFGKNCAASAISSGSTVGPGAILEYKGSVGKPYGHECFIVYGIYVC
mmetsp:Transcript_14005/g.30441  ORF Transcript_14005/g.30441 Transcript_14005/m.30441 type:complete len:102 (+) Transcript_14005:651-956(+)